MFGTRLLGGQVLELFDKPPQWNAQRSPDFRQVKKVETTLTQFVPAYEGLVALEKVCKVRLA